MSNSGPWVDEEFSSTNSALPLGLENANTVLSHRDNYQYTGPTDGTKSELVAAIEDNANWIGSDAAQPFIFDDFSVINGGPTTFGVDYDVDDESSSAYTFHHRSSTSSPLVLLLALFAVSF